MRDEGGLSPWFCVCVWLVVLPCLRQSGDAWLQASLPDGCCENNMFDVKYMQN